MNCKSEKFNLPTSSAIITSKRSEITRWRFDERKKGYAGLVGNHAFIEIYTAVAFCTGLLLAVSDGGWFPWINLVGAGLMLAAAILSTAPGAEARISGRAIHAARLPGTG